MKRNISGCFIIAIASVFLVSMVQAEDICVIGQGKFNDNLNQNKEDSYFKINARIDEFGVASGGIQYLGYINHSGGRNQLVGNVMSFCSQNISALRIVGPYAGYEVTEGAYNRAIICKSNDGKPNFDTMSIDNCSIESDVIDVHDATLFSSGSNVKDTGTAPDGNRGFDDFNIAVVYGANEFATSNGFIRNKQGYVYVGRCDAAPVDPNSIEISCF